MNRNSNKIFRDHGLINTLAQELEKTIINNRFFCKKISLSHKIEGKSKSWHPALLILLSNKSLLSLDNFVWYISPKVSLTHLSISKYVSIGHLKHLNLYDYPFIIFYGTYLRIINLAGYLKSPQLLSFMYHLGNIIRNLITFYNIFPRDNHNNQNLITSLPTELWLHIFPLTWTLAQQ